jgi:cobyric acid synthase
LHNISAALAFDDQGSLQGYEIHCSVSEGIALQRTFAILDDGRGEGAMSYNNIIGTYLHGVFEVMIGSKVRTRRPWRAICCLLLGANESNNVV